MAAALDLFLELEVEEAGEFSFDPGGLDVPTGRDNLIVRAFESLHSADGIAFRLAETIPLAAASAPARRRSSPASSPPTISTSWRSPRRSCWRGRPRSRAIPTTSPRRSTAASSSATPAGRRPPAAALRPARRARGSPRHPRRGGLDRAGARGDPRARSRSATRSPTSPPPPGWSSASSSADPDLIAAGLADRIHQDRRRDLYPRSMEVVDAAPELGALGATISGAGPTVLVWTTWQDAGKVVEALERSLRGLGRGPPHPLHPAGRRRARALMRDSRGAGSAYRAARGGLLG